MSEEITATPLLTPAGGTPAVIDSDAAFKAALEQLAKVVVPLLLTLNVLQAFDTARVLT